MGNGERMGGGGSGDHTVAKVTVQMSGGAGAWSPISMATKKILIS